MKVVTLQLTTPDKIKRRMRNAFSGRKQGAHIGFASAELLFRLLTNKPGKSCAP